MNVINQFSGKYRFLSNFWYHPVYYNGVIYPTNEHAYQASKVLSYDKRAWFATLSTPQIAKKEGKAALNIRKDWDTHKFIVMYEINMIKFLDLGLRVKLLNTGTSALIEGNNWHDNIWGICTCGRCTGGDNNLGKILMKIRNAYLLEDNNEL